MPGWTAAVAAAVVAKHPRVPISAAPNCSWDMPAMTTCTGQISTFSFHTAHMQQVRNATPNDPARATPQPRVAPATCGRDAGAPPLCFAGAVDARSPPAHCCDRPLVMGDTGVWPLARRFRSFPTGTLTGLTHAPIQSATVSATVPMHASAHQPHTHTHTHTQ